MADDTDYRSIAVAQAERLRQLETAADNAQISQSLSQAIDQHPVVDDGRGQLAQILKDKVVLVSGPNGKIAMTADGRTVPALVQETLARQDYRHFLRSDARGPSRPAAPAAQGGATGQPATLADAFRQHIAEQKAAGEDGRTNYKLPMPMNPPTKG
jgi:hypothetical protein